MSKAALMLILLLPAAQVSFGATVCRVSTTGAVAFGGYDVTSLSPADSQVNIGITCDRDGGPANVTLTMGLGAGLHATSVNSRRMLHAGGSGDYLSYGLYSNVGRSTVWGFSPGVDTVARLVTVPKGSASTTFTIYGRIPARQNVSAGVYGDSVQLSINP